MKRVLGWLAVVGAKTDATGVFRGHVGQEGFEVVGVGGLADEDVHSQS